MLEILKKVKVSNLILIFILISYSIISFYKLGNIKNPITYANIKDDNQIIFKIVSGQKPETMMVYNANAESSFTVFYTDDLYDINKYTYDSYFNIDYASVFKWQKVYINYNSNNARYIIFESNLDTSTIRRNTAI